MFLIPNSRLPKQIHHQLANSPCVYFGLVPRPLPADRQIQPYLLRCRHIPLTAGTNPINLLLLLSLQTLLSHTLHLLHLLLLHLLHLLLLPVTEHLQRETTRIISPHQWQHITHTFATPSPHLLPRLHHLCQLCQPGLLGSPQPPRHDRVIVDHLLTPGISIPGDTPLR